MRHSYLQDPGDSGRSGADEALSPVEQSAAPVGHGRSANGSVVASVGQDGRVTELWLDPDLFTRNAVDSSALSRRIVEAINGALDDLSEKAHADVGEVFGGLEAELGRVTTGFSEAIDRVAGQLEQARKRLES